MTLIDELLEGNAHFVADGWKPSDAALTAPPSKHLAIVACMDTRYNVERVLGLEHGDAKIIRNAGNVVDDTGAIVKFLPVSGGWADASDYLQYVATSANATYVMLAAYRDQVLTSLFKRGAS